MAPDAPAADLDRIRKILDEDEAGARFDAEERLRRWAPTADTDVLLDALRDPRNEISEAAATELAARDDHRALDALVREVSLVKRCGAVRDARDAATYPYSESGDLQHGAHARALVKLDAPTAVRPLIEALERVSPRESSGFPSATHSGFGPRCLLKVSTGHPFDCGRALLSDVRCRCHGELPR